MKSDCNSLSNYQIKNPIGRGAGSFVCKIFNRLDKQEYAVKIIQKSHNQSKIDNEVQIHKSLSHPNVVKLIETMEDADNIYLIMELCDQELYQMVKNCKLSEAQIRIYGRQLAEGLKYLHDQNIIHRDLKLGNLLIKGSELKIADFGLAVKLEDSEEERNTLCGTPNYISPEIINNQPYGKKVDLWSMGCCLYSMAMGKGPFEDAALGEVLRKVKLGHFEMPKGMSATFRDLIMNLIHLDADRRYSIDQILQHQFFKDPIPLSIQKQRNQSSSQIKQLLDMSPLVGKQLHRQTNSMVGLEKQGIVNQFLQKQQSIGSKKLLFGLTTIGKQPSSQVPKKYELEHVPRFYLPDDSNKENSNKENIIFNESPLKTNELKPCKLQTKNGQLQIHDDGRFEMEVTGKSLLFVIESNGIQVYMYFNKISVTKKGVTRKVQLRELPQKLQKFYLYSKQVCNTIRERSIKSKITNDHGTFILKNTKSGLQFEAQVQQSGIRILHILNTEVLSVFGSGIEKTVPLKTYQTADICPSEVYSIKIALKYLSQCLI